jgi:hypothetical protein
MSQKNVMLVRRAYEAFNQWAAQPGVGSLPLAPGESWRAAWYDLPYAVRTGRSAFGHRYGTSFYEWMARSATPRAASTR